MSEPRRSWIPTTPSMANEPQYALMSLVTGAQLDGADLTVLLSEWGGC